MSRRFVFVKKGFTKFFALFGECLPEQVYFSLVCSPKNSCLIAWYYDNPRDCKAIRIKIINRGNIRCNTERKNWFYFFKAGSFLPICHQGSN